MRFALATAALTALLGPASVLGGNVTTTHTWTSTVTMTLVRANSTVTMHRSASSGLSATATFSPTSTGPVALGSATPANYIGNGAGSEQSNVVVAGLAGAAALFFGSL
jgi:hypothetical protein